MPSEQAGCAMLVPAHRVRAGGHSAERPPAKKFISLPRDALHTRPVQKALSPLACMVVRQRGRNQSGCGLGVGAFPGRSRRFWQSAYVGVLVLDFGFAQGGDHGFVSAALHARSAPLCEPPRPHPAGKQAVCSRMRGSPAAAFNCPIADCTNGARMPRLRQFQQQRPRFCAFLCRGAQYRA